MVSLNNGEIGTLYRGVSKEEIMLCFSASQLGCQIPRT